MAVLGRALDRPSSPALSASTVCDGARGAPQTHHRRRLPRRAPGRAPVPPNPGPRQSVGVSVSWVVMPGRRPSAQPGGGRPSWSRSRPVRMNSARRVPASRPATRSGGCAPIRMNSAAAGLSQCCRSGSVQGQVLQPTGAVGTDHLVAQADGDGVVGGDRPQHPVTPTAGLACRTGPVPPPAEARAGTAEGGGGRPWSGRQDTAWPPGPRAGGRCCPRAAHGPPWPTPPLP